MTVKKGTNPLIYRYISIPGVIDVLRRRKLAILNPQQWDDRNDRYFMELYQAHCRSKGIYGLCAATRPETYHHWRVFTVGAGGACIVLKRTPLVEYLTATNKEPADPITKVRFGEVKYLTLNAVKEIGRKDVKLLPFLKRWGFRAEAEFRILVETKSEQQAAIYIDCPLNWIDRVYINPWLPRDQVTSLIETLQQIDGCNNLKIAHSKLINSSTWRQVGDRVAGRAPDIEIKVNPQA